MGHFITNTYISTVALSSNSISTFVLIRRWNNFFHRKWILHLQQLSFAWSSDPSSTPNVDFWEQENSPTKMNSVSILLPKIMMEIVVSSISPSSKKMDLQHVLSIREAHIEQRKYLVWYSTLPSSQHPIIIQHHRKEY